MLINVKDNFNRGQKELFLKTCLFILLFKLLVRLKNADIDDMK